MPSVRLERGSQSLVEIAEYRAGFEWEAEGFEWSKGTEVLGAPRKCARRARPLQLPHLKPERKRGKDFFLEQYTSETWSV